MDLSRTIRLSGLTSGAKLDLIHSSRSPSVVSLALQLPVVSAGDPSSGSFTRLIDKFPSNTSLWQILRRFESGVAGGDATKNAAYNFTQRGVPVMANGAASGSGGAVSTGAGRLCYEMPVINIMGRELVSFADLQKTLAQLGFNSGSTLMRLNFRNTETPLEVAMAEIAGFFKDVEEPVPAVGEATPAPEREVAPAKEIKEPADKDNPHTVDHAGHDRQKTQETSPEKADNISTVPSPPPTATTQTHPGPISSSENITIFNPTNRPRPLSATTPHNPADYTPTADHAASHQTLLSSQSRNRKLPSDAEIAADKQARSDRLAAVQSVTVRIRFPDQSMVQKECGRDETVAGLYALCEEVMREDGRGRFSLRVPGAGKGVGVVTLVRGGERLVGDLGWSGRVLATVVWDDEVPVEVRSRVSLKEGWRDKGREIEVDVQAEGEVAGQEVVEDKGKGKSGGGGGEGKEAKMRKLLGRLGKK